MKIARFFAVIFAAVGILLLVGSVGLCMLSLDAPIRVLEIPRGAEECADAFAAALDAGDLTAASLRILGQPDLGAEGTAADAETAMIWDAFLESIAFEYTGKCYATEKGFARDASIAVLDIASVTRKLPERTKTLVNQKIASAGNLEEIYDENGQFHKELVDRIMAEALQQALQQDAQTVIREVTVDLIRQDGAWWAVPDQVLLQTLSGLA